MHKIFTCILLTTYAQGLAAQSATDSTFARSHTSTIIKKGSSPVLIANQFTFTEGPACDKKGNVYFTDQPNNKIWKYDTKEKLSVFLDNAGRSNGLYFDKNGNLLACADENNQLWSIDRRGKVTVLLDNISGLPLNGPNDLWIHPNGAIYFTDPYYQRDYWTRKSPVTNQQNVYYLQRGKTPVILDSTLVQPNGITGTADGEYLYIADIGDNKTYRYRIAVGGTLKERQLFTSQGSDGMSIDKKGNVYLTGNGVSVYDKFGKLLEHIPISAKWTSNVAFGGKRRNQLFITASEAIYKLDMKVRGAD